MMLQILDGKKVALTIQNELRGKIKALGITPCLAIIQIGDIRASSIYISNKKAFAESIGATVRHVKLPEMVSQDEVEKTIDELNEDKDIHGIIMQLPVPAHLNKEFLLERVDSKKDVDGLSGLEPLHTPATARAVMTLLHAYHIELKDKKVVVIGKSRLVGGPIAQCLKKAGAFVEVCDKSTENIPDITKKANIIIVAAGSRGLITQDYVVEGQIIIDVGINSVTGEGETVSHTVGDVSFKEVSAIVSAISPVPGGVGPLTVASLFQNLFDAVRG